jgi:hypothetical protein
MTLEESACAWLGVWTRLAIKVNFPITHRMRRGKLVEIPPEWRGKTLHAQTRRKRQPINRRTRSGP